MEYYDLFFNTIENDALELAEQLGWSGVCVTREYENEKSFRGFADETRKIKSNLEMLVGALITDDIRKNVRNVLPHADLIIASGGSSKLNRGISECWEVDVLVDPEPESTKDFTDQKDSGLDHVMARFMSERGIAYAVDFSSILAVEGRSRVRLLGRLRQNIMLARKYGVPVVFVSGAKGRWGLRAPRELASVGVFLGLSENEAHDSVGKNPLKIMQKSRDRKNPDVITRGLRVVDWGGQKPSHEKKMFGWY